MTPKLSTAPVGGERDPDDYLEMGDGLFSLAHGTMYIP